MVPGRLRAERPQRSLNRARPRKRGSGSLLVATAVLLLLAAGLVALGFSLRSDASDLRSEAAPEVAQLHAQIETQRDDVLALERLRRRAARVGTSFTGLIAAIRAQVDASNHAAEATDFVGDLFNSGDGDGARRALESDVMTSALDDLDAKTRAVARAVEQAREATATLQVVGSD
jgi:hypothetical protein